MLINRVGDIALVLAIMGVIEEFGGLEYSTVDNVLSSACAYSMIGLLLFIGGGGVMPLHIIYVTGFAKTSLIAGERNCIARFRCKVKFCRFSF